MAVSSEHSMPGELPNGNPRRNKRPFVIKWNAAHGRHLVASCTILRGQVIVEEPAIVQGPSPSSLNSRSPPPAFVCISCFGHFHPSEAAFCSKCTLPMCSSVCSLDSIHVENECKIFQCLPEICHLLIPNSSVRDKSHFYQFVTVLRCLFTRSQNPLKWKQIRQLQSNPVLAGSPLRAAIKLLSWDLFSTKRDSEIETEEEDVVQMGFHCLGALQTNSFSDLQKSRSVENLYFFTSLMSHSCHLNAERQFDPCSSHVIVSAIKDIQMGESITVTYLPLCYSTMERQRILSSPPWGFTCHCARCEDPTEFGTFLGSLQCPSCTTLSLSSSPTIKDSSMCSSCYGVFPNASIDSCQKLETAMEVLTTSTDISSWLDVMTGVDWIHPNHSILIQVKAQECQILGEGQDGIRGVSLEGLERKRRYAADVLGVLDKLYPKGTLYLLKGRIKFHLWLAERELCSRKSEPSDTEYLRQLGEEAHEILQLGILGSEEYQMKEILEDEYP